MNLLFLVCALFLFAPSLQAVKHDPFIVVSSPRSGTILLTNVLEKMTGKSCHDITTEHELSYPEWKETLAEASQDKAFIHMHAYPYSSQIKALKKLGHKVIFLIRDPRNQALSLLFFLEENPELSFDHLNTKEGLYASLKFNDKLHEILTGKRTGFCALEDLFDTYIPWTDQGSDFVRTVRFEDLVGRAKGGSTTQRVRALKRIAEFLNLNFSSKQLEEWLGALNASDFAPINEWLEFFQVQHNHELRPRFRVMKKFGYVHEIRENKVRTREIEQNKKKKEKESNVVVKVPKK